MQTRQSSTSLKLAYIDKYSMIITAYTSRVLLTHAQSVSQTGRGEKHTLFPFDIFL